MGGTRRRRALWENLPRWGWAAESCLPSHTSSSPGFENSRYRRNGLRCWRALCVSGHKLGTLLPKKIMGKSLRQLGSRGDFPHGGPRGDVPEKSCGLASAARQRSGPSEGLRGNESLPPPCRAESESGGLWDPSVGGCPCPGAHTWRTVGFWPLCVTFSRRDRCPHPEEPGGLAWNRAMELGESCRWGVHAFLRESSCPLSQLPSCEKPPVFSICPPITRRVCS